jgi:hypothetical protein
MGGRAHPLICDLDQDFEGNAVEVFQKQGLCINGGCPLDPHLS